MTVMHVKSTYHALIECPRWQMETKRVQQVSVETRLSFYDATKLVETTQPAMVSYAAVVKATTRKISVNTDLTWRHNEIQC